MRYCETSAKDNFNVDEIFLKLVDDILSKVEPEQRKNALCVIRSTTKKHFSVLSSGGFDVFNMILS